MSKPYYATGDDLQAKNELASANGIDFASWVLDRIDLAGVTDVLDAGAGWGRFARPLHRRLPRGARLVCCDVSPGMVASCRGNVGAASFAAADVRALPFARDRFDLVLANHMLYELSDVEPAVRELARVVRPGGAIVATTYSDALAVPLIELHLSALSGLGVRVEQEPISTFSLENGEALLRGAFGAVEVVTVDELTIIDPEALTAIYRRTGRFRSMEGSFGAALEVRFRAAAEAAVREQPGLTSTTRWTMFVATQPASP